MRSGLLLHVMSTSCLLCTVTPSLVKIDIVTSSAVLPTLIREVGNSLKVYACLAFVDKAGKGRPVTCWPLLFSLFATMLCLVDGLKMGRRAASLTFLLI
jgi:hypothetical protein